MVLLSLMKLMPILVIRNLGKIHLKTILISSLYKPLVKLGLWQLRELELPMLSDTIIKLLNNVKMPYNISKLNESAAIEALDNRKDFEANKQIILEEKEDVNSRIETVRHYKKNISI